jgi:Cu(I)/Ag(I) efflux system membrane fusion protein
MKRLWSSKITVLGAGAAVLVFAVGYIIGGRGSEARKEPIAHEHQEDQAENREKKGVLHVCPMNCVAPMEKPGRCPVCGMELVAVPSRVYGGEADLPRISLPEKTLKRSGIQVARVEEKFVTAEIRLFGKIEYDPIEQFKVTAFAPGVIDNIYVKRAGQVVRRGDPLFDLNSAELFYLEHEFFETLEKLPLGVDLVPGKGHSESRVGRWQRLLLPPKEPGEKPELSPEANKAIQQSMGQIKRKMRLLGLSDKDVEGLIIKGRPTGISTVTSPMTGVVLEQNAFRGTFVNTGDVVFTIANPRVLWARLDAYAADFPWLRLGQEAEFTTDAYPGKTFKGKVLFLDPEFDAKRKVFKVGVLYRDSMGLLKPNMLVRCVIHAKLTAGGRGMAEMVTQGMMETAQTRRTNAPPLVIPDTAPLITGKRAVVYVEESGEPGTYVGREVDLGPRASGYYLVNAGLKKGEKVVVNGNFKIDSAVQILAKSSMMSQKVSPLPVEHYDYVETPPLPEELEAERPDKGPKHDFHTGQVPKPKDMTESHD